MTVYIAANYTQDIDVARVAEVAGMHPNSAMRLFRQTCGLTVLEYLKMHRIWHAQHLPFDQQAEGPGHRRGQRVQFTEPFLRRL